MRKIVMVITIIISVVILASCQGHPNDISKKYYHELIEVYEAYEEDVRERSARIMADNSEALDVNTSDIFVNTDILEVSWEDTKKEEKGKGNKKKLTEKEEQLVNDFLSLIIIKDLDSTTEDVKRQLIIVNPEYADPLQASIDLEMNIISALELDKKPISLTLQTQRETEQSEPQNERNTKEDYIFDQGTEEENKRKAELEYEPEYMEQEEWENCINGDVYPVQECIDYDQYYANGEGRKETSFNEHSDDNPYEWGYGIKESFEKEIYEKGYLDSTESIIYEKYEPNGYPQGLYSVYAELDGVIERYIVVVDVKTGKYHG